VPAEVTKRVAIVVSVDLLARSRIEDAAARAGWTVELATAPALSERLASSRADLLVLDLDAGGKALLDQVAAGDRDLLPERVVGFYSHVDTELGAAAADAGCDAMPRGKFWRTLPELLSSD
jgi:hypothetical protein